MTENSGLIVPTEMIPTAVPNTIKPNNLWISNKDISVSIGGKVLFRAEQDRNIISVLDNR